MTLAEFTAARLDEDERVAKAADAGGWYRNVEDDINSNEGGYVACGPYNGGVDDNFAAHILAWQPARVLREAAALRKILARHAPHQTASGGLACDWCSDDTDDRPQLAKVRWPCGDVRDIAAIWSDHPDYDPSWERE